MGRNIWVTSDWHLNHAKILTFVDYQQQRVRPEFDNVDQMNQCILDNYNDVVGEQDIVYNLGDLLVGKFDQAIEMIRKLPGSKRLVVGNHDDVVPIVRSAVFKRVYSTLMMPEYNIKFSHEPLHIGSLFRGKDVVTPMLNVFGHIHRMDPPVGPYHNVCVERTNYKPVHIDTLAQIASDYRANQWHSDQSLFSASLSLTQGA